MATKKVKENVETDTEATTEPTEHVCDDHCEHAEALNKARTEVLAAFTTLHYYEELLEGSSRGWIANVESRFKLALGIK